MTPEWKLQSFNWIPLDKWSPSTVMTEPATDVGSRRYCKICDAWVEQSDAKSHVSGHRKEVVELRRRKARENAAQRRQNLAAVRRERKLVA